MYCKRLAIAVVSIAGMLLLSGCGGHDFKTVPVKGKVTYQGKPVTGGSVTFRPIGAKETSAGKPAAGTVQPDGTFVLGTYEKSDGVVPGRHKVSYAAPTVDIKVEIGSDIPPEDGPPSPYAGLVVKEKEYEVVSGKQIDIELVAGQKTQQGTRSSHGDGP